MLDLEFRLRVIRFVGDGSRVRVLSVDVSGMVPRDLSCRVMGEVDRVFGLFVGIVGVVGWDGIQ